MLEAHRTHTRRDRRRPPGGQAPFNTAMRGYQSAYGDCITLWQQLVTRWVALEGQTSKCSHSGWRVRDRGVAQSLSSCRCSSLLVQAETEFTLMVGHAPFFQKNTCTTGASRNLLAHKP